MAATQDELREAFLAGVIWANDQCPVHGYPKLVEGELNARYPKKPEGDDYSGDAGSTKL